MSLKNRLIAHGLISGLSGGLLLAIQGLFFLEKGVEAWQIGLLMGTAVISTTVLELPFGAFADLYGRIKIFRVARFVFLIAALIAIFATSFWHLIVTMALFGLAEALKTGTIDAWAAERINDRDETDKLQTYMAAMQSSLAGGLAIGAVGGGYVPIIMPSIASLPPTAWNLIFIAVLVAVHLALTPLLFHEGEEIAEAQESKHVFAQVWGGVRYSVTNRILRDLLILGAVLGLGMITIEAYWQARLTQIAGEPTYALLGWSTGGYFAMAMIGPMLITAIATKFNISPRVQLLAMPLVFAVSLYIIAVQAMIAPFIAAYMAVMLVMSMFDPPAATILNTETPDELRSTMHSIFSISLRGGATISALGFAGLVKLWGISAVWMLIAAIVLVYAVIRLLLSLKNRAA